VRFDIRHTLRVPPVGLVPLQHVFGKGQGRFAVNRNVVVIVQDNQFAQAPVARQRRGLTRHAFLQATVATNTKCIVVKHLERLAICFFVKGGGQMAFGQGQSDRVGNALSERPRANLDA
jgi:hypothetical protein